MSCLSDTKFVYYLYSVKNKVIMFKKFINVLWTYSAQDYWRAVWSKTSVDEKAEKTLVEIVKRYKLTAAELADVGRAIKEVGSQLGDLGGAVKGKARKGRKKKESK
jgi:ABC-type tungstate transport system substrate-binding protein|tara:strand:+ start:5808 stop:6125 length:318 start_codon:yes stop_codon:yes gene_type:complete